EDADLVCRAETILYCPQHAKMVSALAFEIEPRIDQMLDRLRPSDLPVLGDVADQQDSGAACLRVADEIERGGAHLRDRAGRCFKCRSPDRLDGIDGDDAGRLAL